MNRFKNIYRIGIRGIVVAFILYPFIFSPLTRDFFEINKWFYLQAVTIISLYIWAIKSLINKEITLTTSPITLGVGGIAIASILSLIGSSLNKVEALLSPLGPLTWIALLFILTFVPSLLTAKDRILLRLGLVGGAAAAGLLVLYQQIGLASLLFPQQSIFTDSLFTPLGSPLQLIAYSVLCLPITASLAFHALKEKKELLGAVAIVALVLTTIGTGIMAWKFTTIGISQTLPLTTGFSILRSSWNSIPHIVIGVGPEKFFETYTKYRPASTNLQDGWNIGHSTNASLFLHLGTTFGIVGIISLVICFYCIWTEWSHSTIAKIQALFLCLIWLLAPPSTFICVLPILFSLTLDPKNIVRHQISLPGSGILAIALCFLASTGAYGVIRLYKAELLLYSSLGFANENNGSKSFMLQEEAIKLNPMNPLYHSMLSQTTLLLTQGLVQSSPTSEDGKPKLSEDDRILLTNLVGRSIQEAKSTITLAPTNVQSWITLARVYQGLIGLAKDADTWAIASYQKAIELDPTNPVLHLNLGGLYMTLGQYENAAKSFINALALKPNYIDAYYNLANACLMDKQYDQAVIALEQTKLLVAKDSTESTQINQEILSVLEKKKKVNGAIKNPTIAVPRLAIPN